jgi:hypothetical protein
MAAAMMIVVDNPGQHAADQEIQKEQHHGDGDFHQDPDEAGEKDHPQDHRHGGKATLAIRWEIDERIETRLADPSGRATATRFWGLL